MPHPRFRGVFTALVTPFRDGALDEAAFVALVERQIAGGVHGLVPVGTTGETSTLSHAEHRRVVELCVKTARGRVPVIAGAGSNATAEAIELAGHAKAVGADAALIVTPYYNRPSQEGLYRHYAAINEAVDQRRYRQRHAATPVPPAQHRRDQGRHRRPRPGQPAAADVRAGLGDAVRRRPFGPGLHGPRRPREHFGNL
jgi:hypothetical protein